MYKDTIGFGTLHIFDTKRQHRPVAHCKITLRKLPLHLWHALGGRVLPVFSSTQMGLVIVCQLARS